MTRRAIAFAAAALAAAFLLLPSQASGPFDRHLTPDREIVHALNRLTFGPRPGDVNEVRRIGLTRWMEQQLHPERITENPSLEEKLKPLESLRLGVRDLVAKYSPNMGMRVGMMMAPGFQNPFEV